MGKSSKRNRRAKPSDSSSSDQCGITFNGLDHDLYDWVACVGSHVMFEELSKPELNRVWFTVAHFDAEKRRLIVFHNQKVHTFSDLTFTSAPVAKVGAIQPTTIASNAQVSVVPPYTVPLNMKNSNASFERCGLKRSTVWCVPTTPLPSIQALVDAGGLNQITQQAFLDHVARVPELRNYEVALGWELLGTHVPHECIDKEPDELPGVIHAYCAMMLRHKTSGALLDVSPKSSVYEVGDTKTTFDGVRQISNVSSRLFVPDAMLSQWEENRRYLLGYVHSAISHGRLPTIHRSIDNQPHSFITNDRFAHFEQCNSDVRIACFHDSALQPKDLLGWTAKEDVRNWAMYRPSGTAHPRIPPHENWVVLSRPLVCQLLANLSQMIVQIGPSSVCMFRQDDAWGDHSVCSFCDVRVSDYVECPTCNKFRYCSLACMHVDREAHCKVCPTPERIKFRKLVFDEMEVAKAALKREEYERITRIARQRAHAAEKYALQVEARVRAAAPGRAHVEPRSGPGPRAAVRTTEEELVHQRWDSVEERDSRRHARDVGQAREHANRLEQDVLRREHLLKRVQSEADKRSAALEHHVPAPRSISAVLEDALKH
jgi:hypothetical protein